MALQCLNQFESFEIKPFLADKDLCFVDKKEWKDYQTKKHLGFEFTFVILRDDTKYQQTGNTIKTNRYEKIDVKVAHDVNITLDDLVELVNPTARVYGDYRNQLSITCDDIKVISSKTQTVPTGTARPTLRKEM